MSERQSRRDFVRSTGAALAGLGVLGAGLTRAAVAQGATLRATHFGGPYQALDQIVGKRFADAGHGRIVFEQDQPALILSKWQAQPNNPPYDVGLFVRALTLRAGNAGLATLLDQSSLPALAQTLPGTLAPGGGGVAMVFDSVDVIYDKTKTPSPIESWSDLWRPEFKGKIVLPAMPLAGLIAATLIAFAKGFGGNERNVDEVFGKVKELKASARSFFSDPNQATQLVERGEIVAAPQYSARIAQAMTRTDRIARATPKEGVPVVPYDLVIAKNSPHQELARKYLSFVLTPEIQVEICSKIFLNPVLRGVTLPAAAQALIISDSSKLSVSDDVYVAEKQAGWAERWQREIQA